MKDIYKGVTAVSAAVLTAATLSACGIKAPADAALQDPSMKNPQPADVTYANGIREITLNTTERRRFGTEIVTDSCVDNNYFRSDPEIARLQGQHVLYWSNVLSAFQVDGPTDQVTLEAKQACADDRLTPQDPLPALIGLPY